MRKDLPSGAEFDLLKAELTILASKIANVIDTLWKIRTASITLWTAVLAVGLGSFVNNKEPVMLLLILSCLLPIFFLNIDARNNRWYRRLSCREYALQQYLNDPSFNALGEFPIYDIAGVNTFRDSVHHEWEFSLARNFADPIPLSVYGGQAFFSVVACLLYAPSAIKQPILYSAAVLVLCFIIWVLVTRVRLLKSRPNAA